MNEPTLHLVPNVKSAIDAIAASEGISSPVIDVSPGSEIGDGFVSKTLAINIKGNEKVVDVFVKYFPQDVTNAAAQSFKLAFNTEFRFYEEIFPEMLKFQREKGLLEEEIFDNAPKHFKTGITYDGVPPIVLENLKKSGYCLRNFREPIDDEHMTLALKTFAKYHAISYAMKDQKSDLFNQLTADIKDFFKTAFHAIGIADSLGGMIEAFVNNLDPVADGKLWNDCRNLREVLIGHISTVDKHVDDYAAICQGDCWSNNMMFQYDDKTGIPINIKLIDWQVQRYNSPVLDVVYFFYTVATEDILQNFDKYFKLYYDTLAHQIKKFGSDPRKMYPRVVFFTHWKKLAKLGLTMSFGTLRAQMMKKEEFSDTIGDTNAPVITQNFDGENLYYAKMRTLVQHFIDRDFL